MQWDRQNGKVVIEALDSAEEWLLDRLFKYAHRHEYTKYSSTLKAAWLTSVQRLVEVVRAGLSGDDPLDLHPDDDFLNDPACTFGVIQAQRHRARGVNLSMFLGLFKYYRQTFLDFLHEQVELEDKVAVTCRINRVFDRIEIAFCTEWSGTDSETQIKELATTSRLLANDKNRLLTFFESLHHPSFLLDKKGEVQIMNRAAIRLLGRNGEPGAHYYDQDRRPEPLLFLAAKIQDFLSSSDDDCSFESVFTDREPHRHFEVSLHRLPDMSGRIEGAALTLMDITQRQHCQVSSDEARDRLKKTLDKLKSTQEQLVQSEKMAAVGQLSAGVAHEINNPIGFVSTNIGLLGQYTEQIFHLLGTYRNAVPSIPDTSLRHELTALAEEVEIDFLAEDTPELLQQTREGLQRVTRIVADLMNFSRQSSDEWEAADLNHLIDSTINLMWSQIRFKADLKREFGNVPSVECIPGKLAQVVMNLVVNATHAIERHGTITVATGADDSHAWFSVADDGNGIPEDVKSHIFDPFYTTKPVGKGTGLGLSVSHGIVERHGGQIELDSEPGRGSTFRITIPLIQNGAVEDVGEPIHVGSP